MVVGISSLAFKHRGKTAPRMRLTGNIVQIKMRRLLKKKPTIDFKLTNVTGNWERKITMNKRYAPASTKSKGRVDQIFFPVNKEPHEIAKNTVAKTRQYAQVDEPRIRLK